MALAEAAFRCYLATVVGPMPDGTMVRPDTPEGEMLSSIFSLGRRTNEEIGSRTPVCFVVRRFRENTRILATFSADLNNPVSLAFDRTSPGFASLPQPGAPENDRLVGLARAFGRYHRACLSMPMRVGEEHADAACAGCGAWISANLPHWRVDLRTCVWFRVPVLYGCEEAEYKEAEGWLARLQLCTTCTAPSSPLSCSPACSSDR